VLGFCSGRRPPSAPLNWPSPLLKLGAETHIQLVGLAENRAVSGGWVGGKFLAKETKGLTARQRTKKVEKSGGKTHTENRRASDIQEMKDTILDTTRRAPPSPSFYHALSRYSARSPAPIAAFDCARYNERAGLLLGTMTTQRPTKLALPSSKTGR